MRRSPTIARPSHRICVVSQPTCVERSAPSQLICVETGALLRVGHISIARRYTYGQVTAMAGLPRRARLVGQVLQHLGLWQRDIPWHRVVNAKGEVSYALSRNG